MIEEFDSNVDLWEHKLQIEQILQNEINIQVMKVVFDMESLDVAFCLQVEKLDTSLKVSFFIFRFTLN